MRFLLLLLVFLASCSAKENAPTKEELMAADFGAAPTMASMAAAVRAHLSEKDYVDARGTIINNCNVLDKSWTDGFDEESQAWKRLYGYVVSCTANIKDQYAIYHGDRELRYFYRNNKILHEE